MAHCTLTTPVGQHKIRCQSNRRYIVVVDNMNDAWIYKRSDSLATARQHLNYANAIIYDTVTRQIVQ